MDQRIAEHFSRSVNTCQSPSPSFLFTAPGVRRSVRSIFHFEFCSFFLSCSAPVLLESFSLHFFFLCCFFLLLCFAPNTVRFFFTFCRLTERTFDLFYLKKGVSLEPYTRLGVKQCMLRLNARARVSLCVCVCLCARACVLKYRGW